ncbi:hypothetical protein IFM89_008721 [Coptis chinensis]|uniref:MADS-box domain-containing protein n=1 Tax=Coptis chinensis TaxID=261450 RepID=A0A835GWR3_9MAGN|nr:hypothetical protein IFM89_008721 [Coptis chinensis]
MRYDSSLSLIIFNKDKKWRTVNGGARKEFIKDAAEVSALYGTDVGLIMFFPTGSLTRIDKDILRQFGIPEEDRRQWESEQDEKIMLKKKELEEHKEKLEEELRQIHRENLIQKIPCMANAINVPELAAGKIWEQ